MQVLYNISEKWPIMQILATLFVALSVITSGMFFGWPSPSLPQLQHVNSIIPVTNDQGSWLAVMPLLGACVGSILGVLIVDKVGRKKVLLLTSVPFFAAWVMIAYTKSVAIMLTARFIGGISDGLVFCTMPMYIGEIASSNIRGILGSTSSITWLLGILLINIIGSYTTIQETALISSVFPILLLVTFMWMPESPYFLLMRNQLEDAKRSLQLYRLQKDVDKELEKIAAAVTEQNTNTSKFLDLFTVKSNRRAMLIIIGMRTFQQCSGAMAITFYAQIIFKDVDYNISSTTASIMFFVVQLICSTISSMILDKVGRRPLLILSTIGVSLALFTEGLYFYLKNYILLDYISYSYIAVSAFIFFIVFYAIGLQSIPILLLSELFPTNVKAFAMGFAELYFCILTTVVSKFFQIVKDSYGIHIPFFIFAGCCIVGLVFIIFCVPETKGKTLEEIQIELK